MGEVFVGCNVNVDEKVAIKVMLPALAGDEKVVAMFRKEARTLTKLHHPALVQYRVLAQEPQLGVLYIVTEFIEGTNLGDALGTLKPTPDELAGLLRRLASGLGAAHELGAVHRDMSPDNVLLEDGDIHQAKIIDFGIAKDLDASSATIVGDGFAGKLNYVAPEQLGDFGREVGPWTDVYSLGLVILAVAQRQERRHVAARWSTRSTSAARGRTCRRVPSNLRPIVGDMLKPDPEGPAAVDGRGAAPARTAEAAAGGAGRPTIAAVPPPPVPRRRSRRRRSRPIYEFAEPERRRRLAAAADRARVLLLLAAALAVTWYLTDGTFGFGGGNSQCRAADRPGAPVRRRPPPLWRSRVRR